MPRIKLSDELKLALKNLPGKEKDKLLFRLLPKDKKLVHQLEFKLLEHEETTEARRDEVRQYIINSCSNYPEDYHSPMYLTWNLKDNSGKINYHVAVTKDKIGEIELNLLMLIENLGRNIERLQIEDKWQIRKLAEYVTTRIKKLHSLIAKLHEDYLLEFEDQINELREIIDQLPLFFKIANENKIELELLK